MPTSDTSPNHHQRLSASNAFSAAISALNKAREEGHAQLAYSYAIAAALESLADSGNTSPAALRAIATVFREI
jgi:hypothetical protein